MERDIDDGLFVEFGEYKGNLYGTATRSVKEIVELGYTCILNPHHQVCKNDHLDGGYLIAFATDPEDTKSTSNKNALLS